MFDNKTMQTIDKLTDEELLYSKVQHKERFASLHEAESIIREELEELEDEVVQCRAAFDQLHKAVRYGKLYDACDTKTICNGLHLYATCAAAEAIQLAAMCKKLCEMYMVGNDGGSGERMKTEIEWIPVSEKLPELETIVLITVRDKRTGTVATWTGVRYQSGWARSTSVDCLDMYNDGGFEVIAWAHLPESYKEGVGKSE